MSAVARFAHDRLVIVHLSLLTDHFRGPGRAVGPPCLSVCPVNNSFNEMTADLRIGMLVILTRSSLKVKVTGQSSRSQDENVFSYGSDSCYDAMS